MSALQLDYIALDTLEDWAGSVTRGPHARQVLGVSLYGHTPLALPHALQERPWPQVNLPVLGDVGGGTQAWAEVWTVPADAPPVEHGETHGVAYARSGQLCFAWLATPLGQLDAELATATQRSYDQLFAALQALDCPHPLRFWNYLPDILGHAQGEERYRIFNAGRHVSFQAQGQLLRAHPPAACALGLPPEHAGPLHLFALASDSPAQAVENPRQVSAYHYPEQYGLRRPAFSRASVLKQGGHSAVLISGTASIVGHQTVHLDDVRAQTHETLHNIEALLANMPPTDNGHRWQLGDLRFKAYVRHAHDLPVVQEVMAQRLGPQAASLCLHAVVCRPDLLVEIEAASARSR